MCIQERALRRDVVCECTRVSASSPEALGTSVSRPFMTLKRVTYRLTCSGNAMDAAGIDNADIDDGDGDDGDDVRFFAIGGTGSQISVRL